MKFSLLLLILFYSCSKSSNGNSISRSDLLTNKKWKISAISVKLPNGVTDPDNYSTLPSYKKDDYFYFNVDFTFTDNDNTERSPNDSTGILDAGSWQLANGENDLQMATTLFQTGTAIEYYPTKILELTNTTMYWESTSPYNGTIVWTTYTAIR